MSSKDTFIIMSGLHKKQIKAHCPAPIYAPLREQSWLIHLGTWGYFFFFLAYLHRHEVDHGLSFTPVFPIPLITPMRQETAHALYLESVPEMHQEGCNDCCHQGLGPVNQHSCHRSLTGLKLCNLSPKELLDWGETNAWMMLWEVWASVLTHVPYLLTVRGPLVSWCKRPKWPAPFSWHFIAT